MMNLIHRYGAWLPAIEECPADMACTMHYLRKTSAGKVSSLLSLFVGCAIAKSNELQPIHPSSKKKLGDVAAQNG
jgi:hypothetical protein